MEILELIDNEPQLGERKAHPCTIPGCTKSFGKKRLPIVIIPLTFSLKADALT